MPAASYVDPSQRVVITLCAGEVTLPEVERACLSVRQNDAFRSDFCQLLDLSQVSRMQLHFRDLYGLRHSHDPFSHEARRAVVAVDTSTYGVGRMYQQLVDSPQFEIFRSLPEAVQWLGLNVTALEGIVQPSTIRSSLAPDVGGTELAIPEATSSYLQDFLLRLRLGSG